MNRALVTAIFLLGFTGCQLPPEQAALKPVPDDALPKTYADLLTRARAQAEAANGAFYLNRWSTLEDAARGLGQTAERLAKATDAPLKHRVKLTVEAGDLGLESAALLKAAQAQNEKQANEVMQRINLKVRELRAED